MTSEQEQREREKAQSAWLLLYPFVTVSPREDFIEGWLACVEQAQLEISNVEKGEEAILTSLRELAKQVIDPTILENRDAIAAEILRRLEGGK